MESATKLRLAAVSGAILVAILVVAVVVYSNKFVSAPSGSSSSKTMAPQCLASPTGSMLYIKVVSQTGDLVPANATMNAIPVEVCGDTTVTYAILLRPTLNASGVASVEAAFETYFLVTMHYEGRIYTFRADVHNSTATCATLDVPSGASTVAPCK